MKAALHRERGQIVVIFIFALVGLIGLTALAIDGGMVYSDRRFDQSVADAAALSGAGAASKLISEVKGASFACNNPTIVAAINYAMDEAVKRGKENGFTDANELLKNDLSTHHGVRVECHDVAPKYLEVQVELSSVTNTSLIHVINGQKQVPIAVNSKVRIYGRHPAAPGAAILGLSENCSGSDYGITIGGTALRVEIIDGGYYSNGGVGVSGQPTVIGESMNTSNAACGSSGTGIKGSTENFDPGLDINTGVEKAVVEIDEIDCSAVPLANPPTTNAFGKVWYPGRHEETITGTGELEPGLHCLMNGLKLSGGDTLVGDDGVTLYVAGGTFSTTGSGGTGTAKLIAPTDDTNGGIPGLLIYMDPDNKNADGKVNSIIMKGNSESIFSGTVYSQYGLIDISGNPDAPSFQYTTQFIGYTVSLSGNSTFNVLYKDDGIYEFDAYIDQYE